MEIRLLRADEIECRIGTINEKGLSLLLYKDARADMKILDETFGVFGWKRTHQSIDGNLYCTVEIWDNEKKSWIAKQDVGTVSYTEKEKGQASDSFKRACVSVGIGRELYSAPFIWVLAQKCKIQRRNDKLICYDKFSVSEISYSKDREIMVRSSILCSRKMCIMHSLSVCNFVNLTANSKEQVFCLILCCQDMA